MELGGDEEVKIDLGALVRVCVNGRIAFDNAERDDVFEQIKENFESTCRSFLNFFVVLLITSSISVEGSDKIEVDSSKIPPTSS